MWIGFDELKGLAAFAVGRAVGTVDDALFDARDMRGVFLVVDTRPWWAGRVVLVPFDLVGAPDLGTGRIPLYLEEDRIQRAPSIRQAPPLSREMIARAATDVGWRRMSWGGFVGTTTGPFNDNPAKDHADTALHSAREIGGYRVKAEDGELGRVRDLLFGEGWRVGGLVVETGDWLFPERVAVPARSIAELSWSEQTVQLSLTRAEIRRGPVFRGSEAECEALERRFGISNGSGS